MSLTRKPRQFMPTSPEVKAALQYLAQPTVRPVGSFRMATAADLQGAKPREKDTPHYSEAWRRAVASLPACVRCDRQIGNQAAHRNEGKAMAMKTDDCLTAAMCPECHAEIDQGKTMTQDERRRAMDAAILKTLVRLFRSGKIKVTA